MSFAFSLGLSLEAAASDEAAPEIEIALEIAALATRPRRKLTAEGAATSSGAASSSASKH